MYKIKIFRDGIRITAAVMEKIWLEHMQSHKIVDYGTRRFWTKRRARKWSERQIIKILFEKHELELIDG